MSKIGKAIKTNLINTNVVDTIPTYDPTVNYELDSEVVYNDYIYKKTTNKSGGTGFTTKLTIGDLIYTGDANYICIKDYDTYTFTENAVTKTYESPTWDELISGNSVTKGSYTFTGSVTGSDPHTSYIITLSVTATGDTVFVGKLANVSPLGIEKYDDYGATILPDIDAVFVYDSGYLYFCRNGVQLPNLNEAIRLATIEECGFVISRPNNSHIPFDSIFSEGLAVDGDITYTLSSTEPFNSVFVGGVSGSSVIVNMINNEENTVFTKTILVDSFIYDGNNVWNSGVTTELIELDKTYDTSYKVQVTIKAHIDTQYKTKISEICTSNLIKDGATIKGVELANKILQEDKYLPTGQVDRAKKYKPVIIKYKIIVDRESYLNTKKIHDKLYDEYVVISPTGLESSDLCKDMIPPVVGWMKTTIYKDDGKQDNITIDMEIREKL